MITISPSGGDDTPTIQSAIGTLRAAGGGLIHLTAGTYHISSLDMTAANCCILEGEGIATKIMPLVASNALIDISGSSFLTLRDFRLGQFDQTVVPSTGILSLQDANNTSNWIRMENLMVDGSYSVSAFYCYGVASSKADGCAFWNYYDNSYCVELCEDNVRNMPSQFLANAATTGSFQMSDWLFTGCEFHSLRPTGTCNAFPVRISGGQEIKFHGGNMSGSAGELVTIRKSGHNIPSRNIGFRGVTFYSENGQAPTHAVAVLDQMVGLIYHGCYAQVSGSAILGTNLVSNGSYI